MGASHHYYVLPIIPLDISPFSSILQDFIYASPGQPFGKTDLWKCLYIIRQAAYGYGRRRWTNKGATSTPTKIAQLRQNLCPTHLHTSYSYCVSIWRVRCILMRRINSCRGSKLKYISLSLVTQYTRRSALYLMKPLPSVHKLRDRNPRTKLYRVRRLWRTKTSRLSCYWSIQLYGLGGLSLRYLTAPPVTSNWGATKILVRESCGFW